MDVTTKAGAFTCYLLSSKLSNENMIFFPVDLLSKGLPFSFWNRVVALERECDNVSDFSFSLSLTEQTCIIDEKWGAASNIGQGILPFIWLRKL